MLCDKYNNGYQENDWYYIKQLWREKYGRNS